ncbi:MAG: ABC transporter permease [Rhodoferax sp.]|nr:MAG: ABC transporter permease [Rhodoferax sp.]
MHRLPLLQRLPVPGLGLFGLAAYPLLASLWAALGTLEQAAGWPLLFQQPQVVPALLRSVGTGLVATVLALGACAAIVGSAFGTPRWTRLQAGLAPLLAVPHAALAIGVLALLAPSGWVLRLLSPWATGWDTPPPWTTTQDPWGVGLVLVLACKEIPFLLWAASAHLDRSDVAPRLRRELQWATTLGYTPAQAWWRVGWPQLLPRMDAPLLAVLAYSLTVVDVAWIIGPTTPPTLAVLAWQWLQDADPATHAMGTAAAWLLGAALLVCAGLLKAGLHAALWRGRWSAGWDAGPLPRRRVPWDHWLWQGLLALYGAALLALALGSVVGVWPFPALLAESWSLDAWRSVWAQGDTLRTTAWLAAASSLAALLWSVAWMEWAPASWQQRLAPLWLVPLAMPALLWVMGLHHWLLDTGLDASATGLWLAHCLSVLPYTLLALQGPYRAVDPRLAQVAATLGHGQSAYLLQVKWPLLRVPLLAALAVGFAVSVAQYLPTLYVGAGRFTTVSTEAVAQASGGARALAASFAWLQWLLPWGIFAMAAWWGRSRSTLGRFRRPMALHTSRTPHAESSP